MTTIPRNPKVDAFLRDTETWKREFELLREIVLQFPVTEEVKWGWPCYTFQGANVALIHGFKEYCAVLFPKGVLLKDPGRILIQPTKNMQAARQARFTNEREIAAHKAALKTCLAEAIEAEKSGAKVKFKTTSQFTMPAEFRKRLDADDDLKAAFKALTPGRQRGYLLFFSSAKQSKTREARIDKCAPQILKGKGLQD